MDSHDTGEVHSPEKEAVDGHGYGWQGHGTCIAWSEADKTRQLWPWGDMTLDGCGHRVSAQTAV